MAAGRDEMVKIKQSAFAAAELNGKKPHILSWTVCGTAEGVRRTVGKAWCEENPKEGWKAARIEGMKVLKITMVA
jgi:hypothetical protein